MSTISELEDMRETLEREARDFAAQALRRSTSVGQSDAALLALNGKLKQIEQMSGEQLHAECVRRDQREAEAIREALGRAKNPD